MEEEERNIFTSFSISIKHKLKRFVITVKVVIFACVIFHASAIFDIFVFKLPFFQPSYIDYTQNKHFRAFLISR